MDFLGYRYYKLYRLSLLSLSLWPYGKSFLKQIHAIFCIFLLISSIVTQLLKLFTMEFDLELVLTNLSFAFPSVIYLVKYFAFYIQSQKIKELMEQVQNDWNALKDEQEVEIIKRYAKHGRKHLYIFAGLVYPSTIGFILSPLLPDILDVVAPLNESRTRSLPYLAEYFLDQQKHFYPLLLHINLTIIVGIVTIISTETLFFAYVYHICGMFEITSYRIEHALDESMSILSTLNRENTIRMKIIDAVESHQKAIGLVTCTSTILTLLQIIAQLYINFYEFDLHNFIFFNYYASTHRFFEYMSSTFALSYFILIILGVASLSINLFRLFQVAVIMSDEKENFVLFLIFVVGHFYYMFICNYMGQKIIDNSTGISRKTYDTQWYTAPVQIQKLLLFMMQKSMNSCKFVMGGIYSVSLENFTTLASMSLSYFTVIYSVQQ